MNTNNPFLKGTLGNLGNLADAFKVPQVEMEAIMSFQRENLDAFTAANKAVAEAIRTIATRQADVLSTTMAEVMGAGRDMMKVTDPQQAAAKQADMTKAAFERAIEAVRESTQTLAKSNTEAFEVLGKRVLASFTEIKQMTDSKKGESKAESKRA